MHFLDYKKSLGIAINDKNKTDLFFTKMFNILNYLKEKENFIITDGEYLKFCNTTGVAMHYDNIFGEYYYDVVSVLQTHTDSLKDFFPYYMSLINCLQDDEERVWNSQSFYNLVCDMLDESQIPFEVRQDEDGYFIFPRGAEELDDALVSQNLEWLKGYPKSRNAFIKALREYADQNQMNASDIADKFRKALESFFQEFFVSTKSLENYKSDYGSYLKQHGVATEISNNFETILQEYTNYINNYAKHHDKTSLNVLEYIMYQTGNIIRLLITLEKAEVDSE